MPYMECLETNVPHRFARGDRCDESVGPGDVSKAERGRQGRTSPRLTGER